MTHIFRPRRSALYLPASNAKAIAKARTLDADVILLDLEDAIAPEAKDMARQQAVDAVREGGFGHRELVVRINGLNTPWGTADINALKGCGVDAILLPKISSAADVADYADALGDTALWAMIETCAALFTLREIVAAPQIKCLVMGTNDLAKEMRARLTPDRMAFIPALSMTVMAARAAGISVIDGVMNEIEDLAVLQAQCDQGAVLGFDGKTVIHPNQIATCNAAFSPSASDIAWADTVIAAFADPANADKGAIRVDGKMTELLHLGEAQRIKAMMQAIAG